MPPVRKLPPMLEELRERWGEIDVETGVSLVESFFQLFTSLDDYLREIIKILKRIEASLGITAPPGAPALGPSVITLPTGEEITLPLDQLVNAIFTRFNELVEAGELAVPNVAISELFIGEPAFITYPSEGGTKSIDTAGTIEVDFEAGQVTLPDETTDTIQALAGLGVDSMKSLMVWVSKEAILEIETGKRLTLPPGQAVPLPNVSIKHFKVTISANTDFKFIAATTPMSIPSLLDLRTQEYYTDQYRRALSVDTGGTSVDISPPVKQILIYVDGDDVFVEFNGPIDSDSTKIPDKGSISYPFLTTSVALKAVSSSASVYIRGLR